MNQNKCTMFMKDIIYVIRVVAFWTVMDDKTLLQENQQTINIVNLVKLCE